MARVVEEVVVVVVISGGVEVGGGFDVVTPLSGLSLVGTEQVVVNRVVVRRFVMRLSMMVDVVSTAVVPGIVSMEVEVLGTQTDVAGVTVVLVVQRSVLTVWVVNVGGAVVVKMPDVGTNVVETVSSVLVDVGRVLHCCCCAIVGRWGRGEERSGGDRVCWSVTRKKE